MAKTQPTGKQIKDASVQRDDLDDATVGQAVVKKVIAGEGISISSTGADAGTGDATITNSAHETGDVFWSYRTSKTACLLADRSAVSRTTYANLYNYANANGLIDATGGQVTMFGPGNGSTTFDLPDLRLKVPYGAKAEAAPSLVQSGTTVTTAAGAVVNVTAPAGTTAGNLMLLVFSTNVTPFWGPPGWRLVKTNGPVWVYAKVAQGNSHTSTADDAQIIFPGGAAIVSARIFEVSGADISLIDANGIASDVAPGASAGSSTNPAVTGVTTVRDKALLFYCLQDTTNAAITTPGTLTERMNVSASATNRLVVSTKTKDPSGASGTETFTCSTSALWNGVVVALRPAPTNLGRPGGALSYEHEDEQINDHNFLRSIDTVATGAIGNVRSVTTGDGPGDTVSKTTHQVQHHGGHVNLPPYAALNPFIKT